MASHSSYGVIASQLVRAISLITHHPKQQPGSPLVRTTEAITALANEARASLRQPFPSLLTLSRPGSQLCQAVPRTVSDRDSLEDLFPVHKQTNVGWTERWESKRKEREAACQQHRMDEELKDVGPFAGKHHEGANLPERGMRKAPQGGMIQPCWEEGQR